MKRKPIRWTLTIITVVLLAVYFGAMCWLHHQQLCAADGYASDLTTHLEMAEKGYIYSTASLLIAPVYGMAGTWGIALLVTLFQMAALGVFAAGMKTAAPGLSATVRLLITCNPQLDFVYRRIRDGREFVLDTRELRQVLGEVPLSAPEVSEWIAGFLEEQTAELLREETS